MLDVLFVLIAATLKIKRPGHSLFWDSALYSFGCLLLFARTAMWSMPVVLTEWENENDSVNQNDVAKMTLQK